MTSLRDVLQAIYDQRGKLTPELVLDEARDPNHMLHARFEWRDEIAGEKYRRDQARELIRSVRVTYRDSGGNQRSVREFHSVRREHGHVFEPLNEIVQDEVATRILLADMRRDWLQLKSRYEDFEQFWKLVRDDVNAA